MSIEINLFNEKHRPLRILVEKIADYMADIDYTLCGSTDKESDDLTFMDSMHETRISFIFEDNILSGVFKYTTGVTGLENDEILICAKIIKLVDRDFWNDKYPSTEES